MNAHAKWLTALILVIICSFHVAPATAQTLRAWVAPGGNDANGCTVSAPCQTFQGADQKVGSGGEIICLTGGSYGPLTITKSLTIDCEAPGGNAVYGTGGQGSFYIVTAATDRVILRGLGFDSADRELSGGLLTFAGSGTLVLDHVKINGNNGNGAHGIVFKPNGAARLIVSDSTFTGAGEGASGAGLLVQPASGGSAQVMLERVKVEANIFGIAADGSSSTAGINMTIADSVIASNVNDGIVATTTSGHAPIGVMVKNTKSANNGYGIRAIGSNVTVRVDGSTITGNGTGVAAVSGGALLSTQTNIVEANASNGAFSGSLAFK